MNIEIREVGDKLKELRKKLGLKQEELVKIGSGAGNEKTFTRNLVSMVETGKSPLTKKLAECIEKNIEKCCKERSIPIDFDFEEVCRTPENQIKDYIKEFLESLVDKISIEESIRYGEKLCIVAKKYKLYSEVCDICLKLGDLMSSIESENAIIVYSQAYILKEELDSEKLNWLSLQLKGIRIIQEKYEDALKIDFDMDGEDKKLVAQNLFNDILAMKKLKKYDIALDEVDKLKDFDTDRSSLVNIRLDILAANIYYEQSKFKKCMDIYKSLLKKNLILEDKMIIKCNMLEVKIETAVDYSDILRELTYEIETCQPESKKLLELYFAITKGLQKAGDPQVVDYYKKILDLCIDTKNKETFNRGMSLVLKVENREKDNNISMEEIKLYVTSGLKNELFDKITFHKVMLFFQKRKEYKVVTNLLEKSIG